MWYYIVKGKTMTTKMIEQAQATVKSLNNAWDIATANAINGRASWDRANRLRETSRRAQERFNRRVWKIHH
jgi:hypothetical protein